MTKVVKGYDVTQIGAHIANNDFKIHNFLKIVEIGL